MYEHRRQPLIPLAEFARRMGWNAACALLLMAVSLSGGACGYHWLAQMGWMDSLHNAAMVLTAMGPVEKMPSAAAKLFETAYALFSAAVFLTTFTLLVAPLAHRFLHRFHLAADEEQEPGASR
jgi:hypothetical protein